MFPCFCISMARLRRLPLPAAMRVAYGNGQRIRSVIGRRTFLKIEDQPTHHLDLRFIRPPIPNDSAFDFQRRILAYAEPVLGRYQQGNSPCMTQPERGLNVGRVKDFFNGHDIRLLALENCGQFLINPVKAFVKRAAGIGLNRAIKNGSMPGTVGIDNAIACGSTSGIDTQYSHRQDEPL
jgi:hypothetical protein